ncbi:hypothetical protein IPM65_00590 [Candidatus Roizmanbacteria bacterium]|nr:MAG: hypothetical protein IPM65_00590 [Candidatus Roizmanbacteria bacterium]
MSNLLKIIVVVFFLTIAGLAVYSFALIDPNLTLISHPLWVSFRDPLVHLGYNMRSTSANIYILLLIILFLSHLYFVKHYKKLHPFRLSVGIGLILLLSYPLFSHDLFNYIFDAKILTFYGKNPYQYMPGDFYQDEWLRFMHWTHRTYPYGPSFLVISLVPSFLAMGKFILNFIFFKALFVIGYILTVFYLEKLNNRWAVIFATHPLVLIEGVVNAHNDLISVTLAVIGIFYLWENRQLSSRFWLLMSAGIKYLTLPVVFLSKQNKAVNIAALCLQIILLLYLNFFSQIQPWYFLPLFIFIPFFSKIIDRLQIFLFGLLVSYYPYIRYGGWDTVEKVQMKDTIIYISAGLTALYLLITYLPKLISRSKGN